MRLVVHTETGIVELNWTWLPTWVGMNSALKEEIERTLGPSLVGKELNEQTLNAAHDAVIDFLVKRHPALKGLRDYLDAVKFVEEQ